MMMCSLVGVLLALLLIIFVHDASPSPSSSKRTASVLPRYHTVSGFSSGADMALTHFVAFSAHVTGVGIVGGAPYGCQLLPDAGDACGAMADNDTLPWNQFVDDQFYPYLMARAEKELIDPVSYMVGRNVYLYSGMLDSCVYKPVAEAVERQLRNLTHHHMPHHPQKIRHNGQKNESEQYQNSSFPFPYSTFTTVYDIYSEHAWIVDDFICNDPGRSFTIPYYCGLKPNSDGSSPPIGPAVAAFKENDVDNIGDVPFGCCGSCDAGGNCNGRDPPANVSMSWWRPPINHCGYDMSGAMFTAVIGGGTPLPQQRRRVEDVHLHQFNQSFYAPRNVSDIEQQLAMDESAFVFIPSECRHGSEMRHHCKVHVHYHCCACSYNIPKLGKSLMLKQGLIEWSEPNRIILLFPQTSKQGISGW